MALAFNVLVTLASGLFDTADVLSPVAVASTLTDNGTTWTGLAQQLGSGDFFTATLTTAQAAAAALTSESAPTGYPPVGQFVQIKGMAGTYNLTAYVMTTAGQKYALMSDNRGVFFLLALFATEQFIDSGQNTSIIATNGTTTVVMSNLSMVDAGSTP